MIQKPQIKCCTDCELLVLGKNDMTAIVTILNSLQDIRRIVGSVSMGLDNASLRPIRRCRERFAGVVRSDYMVWSL
jgi:hypothetical protein